MEPLKSLDLEESILSIYTAHCYGGYGYGLDRFLPSDRVWLYGYGRQALAEGLRRVGVCHGDQVVLPGFLCGEVLASVMTVGAAPRFYDVNEKLTIDEQSMERINGERVKALVAVNYFGFPQPLDFIRSWCRTHGAALIEDNAHGFLSADGTVPLGRRGDLGIFSLRKTLHIPNGAALVENRPGQRVREPLAYRGSPQGAEWRCRVKLGLKQVMRIGGLASARLLVSVIRRTRRAMVGEVCGITSEGAETWMPQETFSPLTARLLHRCDLSAECERRRRLYQWCGELFANCKDVQPLFPVLPDGVVPQGFPFLFAGTDPAPLIRAWHRRGVQIVPWPDRLPSAVLENVPGHYRRVMLVPFLW